MKKTKGRRGASAKRSKDPLVDEVRRIRAEVSAEHAHDLAKMCEHLREIEGAHTGKVVHKRRKRSSA